MFSAGDLPFPSGPVACLVSECVIDALQTIEVCVQDGYLVLHTIGYLEILVSKCHESPSVIQAGKFICQGQRPQFFFHSACGR